MPLNLTYHVLHTKKMPEHALCALQVWSLDCQIQHKVDFIRQHVLLPGRPPVVLLAHSIGCYMCLHALAQLDANPPLASVPDPQQQQRAQYLLPVKHQGSSSEAAAPSVKLFVSLFPFFSADFTSARQRLLRIAADWADYIAFAAAGLSKLPQGLRHWLIKKAARTLCYNTPFSSVRCALSYELNRVEVH